VLSALIVCSALSIGQTKTTDSSAGAVYRNASPAVVLIEVYNEKGEVSGAGSGFLISTDGKILTNYHVVQHSKRATVRLANKDAYDDVQVLDVDKRKDVVLLKIKAVDLPYLTLGKSRAVEIGDKVFSLSHPLGLLQNTLSEGIVSGMREADGYRYFQISAPISHGSSGGPIFDSKGEVVAIATAIIEAGQNLNFAVPIDYAKGMLSASNAKPLESVYEPEPDSRASTAMEREPAAPSQAEVLCPRDEQTAQEVLRLGRGLGYQDDEILEAYGYDACKTLSFLRHEFRQREQLTSPPSTKIPTGAQSRSEQLCQSNERTAQEVLRLGRSLGYPDQEIVEAYGEDACKTLAYLQHEAQQKAQPTPLPAAQIPSGMIEALSYEYDADVGDVLQTVQTDAEFYGIRCQAKGFAKCGWLSRGVRYKAEIEGRYIYVTTYKDGNPQKPQRIKFEILVIKSR